MAFNQPAQRTNVASMPQRGNWNNDNRRRPEAYLNVSIPVKRGNGTTGKTKLEGIKLYADDNIQNKLIEMFREDPDGAADRLRDALIIEFNEAGVNENAEVLI